MIDVLLMKMYSWSPEGGTPTISEIPESEMEKARELNQKLVEAAAENDETLMEKFFEQGSLTEDEMREGIRKGLITRSIYPVFCVSALRDMGVRQYDGIPRQRSPLCLRNAQTRKYSRRKNRSRCQWAYKYILL